MLKTFILATILFGFSSIAIGEVVLEPVEYEDKGLNFLGWVAYQKQNADRRPGILVMHEWWGLNDYAKQRAADYARLGYVAFALDMYGKGVLARTVDEASQLSKPFYDNRNLFRQRAELGLQQLMKHRLVDQLRVATIGYCFGGTTGLELARGGAPVRGTVVFHGGLSRGAGSGEAKITGKVLVLNGADDPMVKPLERETFMQEMRAGSVDWQFVEYGNSLHAFSNPGVDKFNIPGAKYNHLTDRRSFELSRIFLAELFQN